MKKQPGLMFRVMYEIEQEKKYGIKSKFLMLLRRALRAVLRSLDYTLVATSLLKEIDIHPETSHRFLNLLCPTSDYEALWRLFNYKGIVEHVRAYIKDQNIAQIEKDMRLLRDRLKMILGDEREIKYWGRKVNWAKNVTIPIPSKDENYNDKDQNQKNSSLGRLSTVVLDYNDEIQEVVLQVLETGTPNRPLFTIIMEPRQKIEEEQVKILLHNYASKAGYNTSSHASEIPLNIEDRGKGLTVYSVKESSIIPLKSSRWYLHIDLKVIGYRKMNSIEKRIEKIQSDASIPGEKRDELVRQYRIERNKVKNKRLYQMLTVKMKGLLLYSLVESDPKVFNEIIGNISRYNKYDNDDFDPHYDGVIFTNTRNLDQVRKMDFPFLLDYYKFSHILPPNFALDVLKRIAREFHSRLETISPSALKFEVTSRFFAEVREHLWGKSSLIIRKIEFVPDELFPILNNYHSTVGSYVRRKQKMIIAFEDHIWGEEINYNRLRPQTLQK